MHILFLSDNFPPEVNAPASRTYEHCREWVRTGHKVTVITCAPNFPKGKVFEGYRNRIYQVEIMDGIRVIRVWSYVTANEGFLRRVLDYLSFMMSAIFVSPFVGGVDIVVGTSPQFFTACAAFVVGKLKRRPWVFELRDLWPETIKTIGAMNESLAIRFLERIEMFLYRHADAIVSVTESFRRVLINRGINGEKIFVVTNGVDFSQFTPRKKDEELLRKHGLFGKFVVGYIGTHGMCQALETVIDAAGALKDHDIAVVMLGDGARKQSLRERADAHGIRNIVFLDTVSKSEVSRFWSILDLSVTHLQRAPLFTTVIPSKLFESMGMGIPVLHGVEGESAEIVRRYQVGVTFTPEDSADLSQKILQLKADSARLAELVKNCAESAPQFDRTALALRMLDVLKSLVHVGSAESGVVSQTGRHSHDSH